MSQPFHLVIVGMGKVGQPLSAWASSRGLRVTGVDIDPVVVEKVNAGHVSFDEQGMAPLIAKAVETGLLSATTDLATASASADAVIVIVPALVDERKQIDLSAVMSVTQTLAHCLPSGALVAYETTLPIGATRSKIAPVFTAEGRKIDEDIFIVYSPERIKSRQALWQFANVPKIVGAYGPSSREGGLDFYRRLFDRRVIDVGSLENAEAAKLVDMAYRDVNIALVNELSEYLAAAGVDIYTVIPAANTHRESHLHQPGVGVGGHCTPVYPWFMINDARRREKPLLLMESARAINDRQAERAVASVATALGEIPETRLMIMGLAFRPDVPNDTLSPAYLVRDAARRLGWQVLLCDPYFSDAYIGNAGFKPTRHDAPGHIDAVIMVTAHAAFLPLDFEGLARRGVKVFYDGRNAASSEETATAGIIYRSPAT